MAVKTVKMAFTRSAQTISFDPSHFKLGLYSISRRREPKQGSWRTDSLGAQVADGYRPGDQNG